MLADTFGKRLVGIHGAPRSWGVLIPGRYVHGMFIVRRLWTVGLDRGLRVLRVRRLSWKGGVSLWPGY